MRAIEKQILSCLAAGIRGLHQLSERDLVTIYADGTKSYKLWGTELYHMNCGGEEYFYFSNRAADTPDCMSATTASRINALLYHTPCSVYRRKGKLYDQHSHIVHTNCMYKIVDGILVPCDRGMTDE